MCVHAYMPLYVRMCLYYPSLQKLPYDHFCKLCLFQKQSFGQENVPV